MPLAGRIRRVLEERSGREEDYMTADKANQTLRAVTDWGRYAEAFAYHEATDQFSLENPT